MFLSIFRNVFIAEVLTGRPARWLQSACQYLRPCVATVTHKLKKAHGEHESVILTDSQGNKIDGSEGTRDMFDHVIMFAV